MGKQVIGGGHFCLVSTNFTYGDWATLPPGKPKKPSKNKGGGAFFAEKKGNKNFLKNVLTNGKRCDIMMSVPRKSELFAGVAQWQSS